ncbi:hypothetical protein LCGC14_0342540 [marine sediment metagenome]|uniref:Uncharacterized protein n=1 Tax=marine sediment metagenome TaxID=412755 RepID=A0A0F9W0P8_9ZZZZ
MENLLGQKLFTLNGENLIIRFNRELLEVFTNMRSHPNTFSRCWFSTYPYRRLGENLIYAKNHFNIKFAAGSSTLWIRANVKYDAKIGGWWYDVSEWYSLHDGREYNKNMTINDLLTIFKRHKIDTKIDFNRGTVETLTELKGNHYTRNGYNMPP